jgi:hypothetical protein
MSVATRIKADLADELTERVPGTPPCPRAGVTRVDEGWEAVYA